MTKETFGSRFKALRIQKGLTQDKIAKMFYLNTSSISKYEKDRSMPEISLLIRMSDFFGVSVDYLLCCSDSPGRISKGLHGVLIADTGKTTELTTDELELMGSLLQLPESTKKELQDYLRFKTKNQNFT